MGDKLQAHYVSAVVHNKNRTISSRQSLLDRLFTYEDELRERTAVLGVSELIKNETTSTVLSCLRTLATELKANDPCAPEIPASLPDSELALLLGAPLQQLQMAHTSQSGQQPIQRLHIAAPVPSASNGLRAAVDEIWR